MAQNTTTVKGCYDLIFEREGVRERFITDLKVCSANRSLAFLRRAQRGKWDSLWILRVWTEHTSKSAQKIDDEVFRKILSRRQPKPVALADENEILKHSADWFPDGKTATDKMSFDL